MISIIYDGKYGLSYFTIWQILQKDPSNPKTKNLL